MDKCGCIAVESAIRLESLAFLYSLQIRIDRDDRCLNHIANSRCDRFVRKNPDDPKTRFRMYG